MSKVVVFLLAVILMTATSLTGCAGDSGSGEVAPKAGPDSRLEAGQSAISLTLSGGHLSAPVEFAGTVDKTMSVFSSSMTFLGPGLDLAGTNSTAVLTQMVLSIESSKAGTYQVQDVDSDMVFYFPDVKKGYSIEPRDGAGTVKVERLDGKHVRLHLDFDASPTNIGGRDQIFHIKGVLESKPRVRN